MSFILDALRKADARRGAADMPDLPTLPAAATVTAATSVLPRVAVGAAILVAGVAAATVWFAREPTPTVARAESSRVATPSQSMALPGPRTPSPVDASIVVRDPAVRPLDREAAFAQPPGARAQPAAPDRPTSSAGATREKSVDRTAPVTPGRVVYSDVPLDAPVDTSQWTPARDRPPSPAPRGSGSDVMMYSEFALNNRSGAPPLRLDVHVYSDDPASRFVFVNNRKYRESDLVEGDILVELITPDGAILSLRGQRFLLSRR